jgi:hypothetical protein
MDFRCELMKVEDVDDDAKQIAEARRDPGFVQRCGMLAGVLRAG